MNKNITVKGIKCVCVANEESTRIVYMIYPNVDFFDEKWLGLQSNKNHCAIVMVYVPLDKWNDYMTPWPEPGETPKAKPFAGEGADFLKILQNDIIPSAENTLGIDNLTARNLVGVSLGGLFTFWQWMICDSFRSVACISGSFWYMGFMDWFERLTIPSRQGKAYFLLGSDEPKAHIKAFRSVGKDTEAIASALREAGIDTAFEWVPGNHFSNPIQRAEMALAHLAN